MAAHVDYLTGRDAIAKFKSQHFDWLNPVDGAARHRKVIATSKDPQEIKRELAIVAELTTPFAQEAQARLFRMALDLAVPMTAASERGMRAALAKAEELQASARGDENALAGKYALAPGSMSGISSRFEACKRELQQMIKDLHPNSPHAAAMMPTGQDHFWLWLGLPV